MSECSPIRICKDSVFCGLFHGILQLVLVVQTIGTGLCQTGRYHLKLWHHIVVDRLASDALRAVYPFLFLFDCVKGPLSPSTLRW